MRLVICILFFLISNSVLSQTPEDDEIKFQSAIDWLNSKLNYIYYDDVGGKWWKNTFYVNEDKVVTLKHISSSKPNTANLKDKNYIIRTFRIQDLNPASLKVSQVEKSQGRLVKGKMLELRTFGFQNQIHKTINGKRGSSTSFLYLSFPDMLNDSISNYAEIVRAKFEEAALASTQLYPSGDERDIETILTTLSGTFKSEEDAIWTGEKIMPTVLEINPNQNPIQYFSYDLNRKSFYLMNITDEGVETSSFILDNDSVLILQKDSVEVFKFPTKNSFIYNNKLYTRQ